jgi:hypothetical protein
MGEQPMSKQDTIEAMLAPSFHNSPPANLFTEHERGKGIVFLPLEQGWIKLEYDDDGDLQLISFVLEEHEAERAVGPRLELGGGTVTFITENGVSGLQWSDGEVIWGHTYDSDGSPAPGRKIDLPAWIDECVDKMVNPDRDDLTELLELERQRASAPGIATMLDDYMAGRIAALHDLLEYNAVASRADVDALVHAIREGIARKDAHLVSMSSGVLELTRVEREYAVQQLTASLAHALDRGAEDAAETISFSVGEMLAAADSGTIAALEKLAPDLDNEYLARMLKRR